MSTTAQTDPVAQMKSAGLAGLSFARMVLNKLAEGFPADKVTSQPFAKANHLMWIFGHVAMTDDFFLASIASSKPRCPEGWNELFGMNSEPVDDPSKYPSFEEVRAKANECRQAVEEWFNGMDGAELAEPLSEDLKAFAPTKGALMSSMAAHEGMHAGQITDLRRALGLPRAFG